MVNTISVLLLATGGVLFGLGEASVLAPRAVSYTTYKGDGTVESGFPDVSDWADFKTIWQASRPYTSSACDWLGVGANSVAENRALRAAIHSAAETSGLDARFILAVVMQESQGCVRVTTSVSPNEGIRNPGLMQCFNGEHTCNDAGKGVELRTPCPGSEIKGMITDGVGITTSDGLMQTVERSGADGVEKYYRGAVLYNSGILPDSLNLGEGRSNPCYASDIANRLMGWVGDSSPCSRDTVGDL